MESVESVLRAAAEAPEQPGLQPHLASWHRITGKRRVAQTVLEQALFARATGPSGSEPLVRGAASSAGCTAKAEESVEPRAYPRELKGAV
eukprot:11156810-Heterocapsa_arctica.AAC.1